MKRFTIFILILALGVPRVFSYSPLVEPDLKYLPAILDSTLTYNWDSDSGKYLSDIRRYFYDENGNLITAEVNSGCFMFLSHHYDGDHRFSFSYDSKGQRISYYAECYDSELNIWVAEEKIGWSYDENGNQIEEIYFFWTGLNNWVESSKRNWTYDENGNQIECVEYDKSGTNDWVESSKSNWLYDENGHLLEEFDYSWNSVIFHWINEERSANTFDEDGNLVEEIKYTWDSDIRDWVGNWKWNGAYDEDGNQIERIAYEWESETDDWVGSWKWNRAYDKYGNQIEYIEYDWSSDKNDWVWTDERRTDYINDENGNLIEYIEYYKDSPATDWIVRSEFYAYWSELTTSIRTGKEDLQCLIYPNPAKDYLIIETTGSNEYLLTINSQNGQQIFYEGFKGNTHQLDLSSFEPGVYFITVRSKDFMTTRKIVKY